MACLVYVWPGRPSWPDAIPASKFLNHNDGRSHEGSNFGNSFVYLTAFFAMSSEGQPESKMWYGEKDFLDQLHRSRPRGRFHPAAVVGAGGDDPHYLRQLVDRIP